MLRKSENLNKLSAKELADYRQAQAESLSLAHEEMAAEKNKAEIVVRGLQSKYGFSEAGAKETMRVIAQGWHMYANQTYLDMAIDAGRFGKDAAKIQAARNAYNYYHNVK